MLAASNAVARRHELLDLSVDYAGHVAVRGLRPGEGAIASQMIADRRGVSYAVERRGTTGWYALGTRWSDFLPASGHALDRALR